MSTLLPLHPLPTTIAEWSRRLAGNKVGRGMYDAKARLEMIIANEKAGMILHSLPGLGKTTLIQQMLDQLAPGRRLDTDVHEYRELRKVLIEGDHNNKIVVSDESDYIVSSPNAIQSCNAALNGPGKPPGWPELAGHAWIGRVRIVILTNLNLDDPRVFATYDKKVQGKLTALLRRAPLLGIYYEPADLVEYTLGLAVTIGLISHYRTSGLAIPLQSQQHALTTFGLYRHQLKDISPRGLRELAETLDSDRRNNRREDAWKSQLLDPSKVGMPKSDEKVPNLRRLGGGDTAGECEATLEKLWHNGWPKPALGGLLSRKIEIEDTLYHSVMEWVVNNTTGCSFVPLDVKAAAVAVQVKFQSDQDALAFKLAWPDL